MDASEAEATAAATPLALNPGQKRKGSSLGRCCLWTVGLLSLLCSAFVLWFLFGFIQQIFLQFKAPHREHIYNATAADDQPVIPILERNSTFDVGVSVWIRKPENEIERIWVEHAEQGLLVEGLSEEELGELELQDFWESDEEEELIYSQVPPGLRNITLADKDVFTDIKLTIPTGRFCGHNLTNRDLRASFVLIPTSPSPFDNLKNFSSMFPTDMYKRPRRPWPFPLGSSSSTEKSLRDRAIDEAGISTHLIWFENHEYTVPFNDTTTANATESADEAKSEDKEISDDDELDDDLVLDTLPVKKPAEKKKITKITPPFRHPYFVARTQLRIYEDYSVYSLKKYNKKHIEIKRDICGKDPNDQPPKSGIYITQTTNNDHKAKPHWSRCGSNDHGPFGTRLQLDTGEKRSQRAYLPALGVNSHVVGPLDHIRIPVNRSQTAEWDRETQTWLPLPPPASCVLNDTMEVTWRVSVRGRTPLKTTLSDIFLGAWVGQSTLNASDHSRAAQHGTNEMANGVFGNRYHPDSHPRRRFATYIVSTALVFLSWVLNISYFYTRTSTVGISVWTNLVSPFVSIFHVLYLTVDFSQPRGTIIFSTLLSVLLAFTDLAQLKNGLRVEFVWTGGIIPRIRRNLASHRERASLRVDRSFVTGRAALICLGFWCMHYFLIPRHFDIIPSRLPAPSAFDLQDALKHRFVDATCNALYQLSSLFQIFFNHSAGTYGGSYKSVAYMLAMTRVFDLLRFVNAFTGRWDSRGSFSLFAVVDCALVATKAWQAWTLPAADPNEIEED